jgi:hypothetical protein
MALKTFGVILEQLTAGPGFANVCRAELLRQGLDICVISKDEVTFTEGPSNGRNEVGVQRRTP